MRGLEGGGGEGEGQEGEWNSMKCSQRCAVRRRFILTYS